MREGSIQHNLITKNSFNFNLLIALLCGALISAHFLFSFFPEIRLWGINHLAYFPLWARIIFTLSGLLILLPVINSKVAQTLDRFFSFLSKIFAGREVIGASLLSLFFILLFWFVRTRTHFLGDGYTYLSQLESGNYLKIKTEALEIFTHIYLYRFLNIFFSPSTEFVYAGLSILAGAIFIFVLFFLMRTISHDGFDRFFVFTLFLFSGSTQLFLGYVEHYSLTYLCIFVYLYFSIRYLQGKVGIFPPILFCLVSVGLHLSSAILLPSLCFLLATQTRQYKIHLNVKGLFFGFLILASLLSLSVYFVWSIQPNLWDIFVPLSNGRALAPDHTLISIPHILDIINQHLLLCPVGIILLIALCFTCWKIIRIKNHIALFLITVFLAQFLFHFLVDPKFGAARDWDLFSSMALGYSLLGVYLLINYCKERRYSIVVMAVVGMLLSLPWFIINANAELAINRFENMLDLDPKRNRSGRYILAEYYSQEKRYTEKNETWSKIFSVFPEDSLTRIAEAAIKRGDYDQAHRFLNKAIEINPDFDNAYGLLGITYLARDQVDEALNTLERAVQLNPYQKVFRVSLASSLFKKGRLKEALEQFKKAEKLGGIGDDEYYNMGYIQFKLGEMENAIKNYQKVLKINPEFNNAYYGLGQAYLALDSLDKALVEFNQFLQLEPDCAPLYYHLGLVYSKKGLNEKAIENFELFLKISTDEIQKEKVKELIRRLRFQN